MGHDSLYLQKVMENPTQFDLNNAIHQWRQSLESSSAVRREDLDELESHLRESSRALVTRGFTWREAFLVAAHRLGAKQELETEFAKVNIRQVWSERTVWILCGLLAANALWAIVSVFSNAVLNLALWHGMNAQIAAVLTFVCKWLAMGALVAGGFLGLTRQSLPLSRIAQPGLQRPIWTGVALVIALEGLQLLPRHAMRLLEPLWQTVANPARTVAESNMAVIQGWFFWEWLTTQLLFVASVPLFAGYLWNKTGSPQPRNSARSAESYEPTDEAVRDLKERGLSVQEAVLLINQRRNDTAVPGENNAPVSKPWLERCLWLLVGAVTGRLLVPFILEPSTILVSASSGSSLPIQHLAGFGSMCLCLGAMGGMLVALSHILIKYQCQVKSIGTLCGERPTLTATISVAIFLGIGVSLYRLAPMILPAQHGISAIGSQWLDYSAMVTQLIVPVALLIWFGRIRKTKIRRVV